MIYGMTICKSIEDKDDYGYCWSVGEYNEQIKQANELNLKFTRLCGKPTPLGVGVSENKK